MKRGNNLSFLLNVLLNLHSMPFLGPDFGMLVVRPVVVLRVGVEVLEMMVVVMWLFLVMWWR